MSGIDMKLPLNQEYRIQRIQYWYQARYAVCQNVPWQVLKLRDASDIQHLRYLTAYSLTNSRSPITPRLLGRPSRQYPSHKERHLPPTTPWSKVWLAVHSSSNTTLLDKEAKAATVYMAVIDHQITLEETLPAPVTGIVDVHHWRNDG